MPLGTKTTQTDSDAKPKRFLGRAWPMIYTDKLKRLRDKL